MAFMSDPEYLRSKVPPKSGTVAAPVVIRRGERFEIMPQVRTSDEACIALLADYQATKRARKAELRAREG